MFESGSASALGQLDWSLAIASRTRPFLRRGIALTDDAESRSVPNKDRDRMVGDPHRPICCQEVVSVVADIDRVRAKGQCLSVQRDGSRLRTHSAAGRSTIW